MKKVLASVVLAALPTTLLADVIVYGKANVALQHADENGDSKMELVSNSSRIGLKGSEDISEGLKVIYQFEYQTDVDDGDRSDRGEGRTFSQRNIYIGLQGKAGTIMGGMFDTPLKVAQEKVDVFNDLEGDLGAIFNGETRAKNIIQYVAPGSIGPFSASVAYIASEEDNRDDGVSASVGYAPENMYFGLAMDQDVQAEDLDIMRAVARITIQSVQLGALYERSDNGLDDGEGFLVSALWNLNAALALKAQYGVSDHIESNPVYDPFIEQESLSVGADYRLSKSTTLYGFYTQVESDGGSNSNPESVRDDKYLGVGIDFKF